MVGYFHQPSLSPGDPRPEHPHASIVFNVTNDGRSAAHHVLCEIHFDERHLIPDDMYGQNYDFDRPRLGPTATEPHAINAAVLAHGPTEARYRFVCDEVGESEGTIEFKVPEWKNSLGNWRTRSGEVLLNRSGMIGGVYRWG